MIERTGLEPAGLLLYRINHRLIRHPAFHNLLANSQPGRVHL